MGTHPIRSGFMSLFEIALNLGQWVRTGWVRTSKGGWGLVPFWPRTRVGSP